MRTLDMNRPVADLVRENPELAEILKELGFTEIVKPLMLNTVGRMMTIPKGADAKDISLRHVVETLREKGYVLTHIPGEEEPREYAAETAVELTQREQILKDYIGRLRSGEDLEAIQAEFKEQFSDVSAAEIARAEQALLREGTPLSEVQRLCDVHSALFHGATRSERIANAEKEVIRSSQEQNIHTIVSAFDETVAGKVQAMEMEDGHPLNILTLENMALEPLMDELQSELEAGKKTTELKDKLQKLKEITRHYGKKDELLFPLLKDKYHFPGPADVMWGVEDELVAGLRRVMESDQDEAETLSAVLKRMKEMIYKEINILFPLCGEYFTGEEWQDIAADMPMFGYALIEQVPEWAGKRIDRAKEEMLQNDEIHLPGGSMNVKQLRAMLNTLPMEITLIDENEINRFFNEGDKLFTRPSMALGRSMYSCHPMRVMPMVKMLIHEFKTGRRDAMHIWGIKGGKNVLIHYYALRDESGAYLGTMEAVEQMDEIMRHVKDGAKKGPVKYGQMK